MKIHTGVDQGSADWFRLRLGIPTASCFDKIITAKTMKPSESWKGYACRLIAERLLNQPMESVQGQAWMERGKELEPMAVRYYEAVHEVDTQPISFITDDKGLMGASPDRVVFRGDAIERTVEIKCPSLPVHLHYHLIGHDAAYVPQIQGQLWIAEADEGVFISYFPLGPTLVTRTHRDEKFIRALADCMARFQDNLHEMEERARALGDWQAFKTIHTPVEIEDADNLHRAPMVSDAELQRAIVGEYAWGG